MVIACGIHIDESRSASNEGRVDSARAECAMVPALEAVGQPVKYSCVWMI